MALQSQVLLTDHFHLALTMSNQQAEVARLHLYHCPIHPVSQQRAQRMCSQEDPHY